jgi:type IV secretion system protein VirB5
MPSSLSAASSEQETVMLKCLVRALVYTFILGTMLVSPAAVAQFAVIDEGSLAELIAQAKILQGQLLAAQNLLSQSKSAYAATIGGRGMEQLLAGVQRNYLPTDWSSLQSAMRGGSKGGYASLSVGIAAAIAENSVLSPQQMASLSPNMQQSITASRQLTALQQVVARQALANSSGRFATLQQLINALPAASDQKAALDLQARISAENSMLQNEQTKLLTLSQIMLAEERANDTQSRERAIAARGQFATRFQPTP